MHNERSIRYQNSIDVIIPVVLANTSRIRPGDVTAAKGTRYVQTHRPPSSPLLVHVSSEMGHIGMLLIRTYTAVPVLQGPESSDKQYL